MIEKLVFGVGGADDGVYPEHAMINARVDFERPCDPYYARWTHVLYQCRIENWSRTDPAREPCKVVPEWRSFQVFKAWMKTHDWRHKALCKDLIIPGNRLYAPERCVFVPADVNCLLKVDRYGQGEYPPGVSTFRGKYRAHCPRGKEKVFLGDYDTPEEAHAAYCRFKYLLIRKAAGEQTDTVIKAGLMNWRIPTC